MKSLILVCAIALLLPTFSFAQAAPVTDADVSAPASSDLVELIQTFLEVADPEPLIDFLIIAKEIEPLPEDIKIEVEKLLLAYTKPLPAANAEANMRGYQALAVLAPSNSTYSSKAKSYRDALNHKKSAVLRRLKRKHNEFDGQTWYEHPNVPRYTDTRNYLEVYLGEKDNRAWLRMRLNYTSDSWLFISSASANIDGEMVRFPMSDWDRDNDTEIWEWADVMLTDDLRDIALRIANSKKTIIRFVGRQYHDDWTVPSKDKQAILDMFLAEDVLKEQIASR